MAKSPTSKRARKSPAAAAAPLTARHYCAQPALPPPVFQETLSGLRAEAILDKQLVWANGTDITYFLHSTGKFGGSAAAHARVDKAFKQWKGYKIGLTFTKVTDPKKAMLRIGFEQNNRSWSYVGRDNLGEKDPKKLTMNLGWSLANTYGYGTALHEIGHALGLKHEHQNPNSGIVWNVPNVKAYFSGPPNNWDVSTIQRNILDKLQPKTVMGSKWDPSSIMHYQFEAGMIDVPAVYKTKPLIPPATISADDIAWVTKTYPPVGKAFTALKPLQSAPVAVVSPGQRDFLIEPKDTRKYNVRLFGTADTTLLLYELDSKGKEIYIAGKTDVGSAENAALEERLYADHKYVVKVKVDYTPDPAGLSIMAW